MPGGLKGRNVRAHGAGSARGKPDYLGLGKARASKVQSAKQDAVRSNVTRILDPEHAPTHDYEITVDSKGHALYGYSDGCVSAGCIAGTAPIQ